MSKSSTVRRCWLWLADQGAGGLSVSWERPGSSPGRRTIGIPIGVSRIGVRGLVALPRSRPANPEPGNQKATHRRPGLDPGPSTGRQDQSIRAGPVRQGACALSLKAHKQPTGGPNQGIPDPGLTRLKPATRRMRRACPVRAVAIRLPRTTAPDFVVPLSPRRRVFPPGLGTRGASVRSGRPDRRSAPTDRGCGAWSGLRCRWRCRSGRWCRPSTSWRRARSSGPAC